MSTAVSREGKVDPRRGLRLLSLDAGGPQGISQLHILQNIMEKISEDTGDADQVVMKRPCDVFDAIGGVGTGGLIAILLVVLKMTVKEALGEFTQFATDVFKDVLRDPQKQTEKLKRSIEKILEKHGIDKAAELIPANAPNPSCRLMVPVMYRSNATASCVLRNYTIRHEPSTSLSVAEAMLATCAAPPIFTPTRISKDSAVFEYVGGDIGLSNPTREIITEAHRAFGNEATVSCLLSIGSGHPGTAMVPSGSDTTSWMNFFQRVSMDSERTAREIASQMVQLSLYQRFSVAYGLESSHSLKWSDPGVLSTHTITYLEDMEIKELLVRCVEMIETGAGFTTLEQLSQAGGAEILPPPLPPLASTYVERKEAMRFVEQAVFDEFGDVKPGSKRVVVTGIGGCGKTQLIRKFAEKHGTRFASVFFVDGSNKDALQRDVVHHIRSLGGSHSQASFSDAMAYLSQHLPEGERLLVIDNVDDADLNLSPFLPRWKNGTIIITSRNPSRGQLSPAAHLQLDVMTLDESVELLVLGMGWDWPPSEFDRQAATAVAEELGCHPIALVQAISYMSMTGYSAETIISRLRKYRTQLLEDPATSQVDMRYKTAFAAFDASYELLSTAAQHFLHLLSFLHSQKFPLELVIRAAERGFSIDRYPYLQRGDEFKQAVECLKEMFCPSGRWNPVELDSIVAILRSHSLLIVTSSGGTTLLQMHSLIHEWARLRISAASVGLFQAAAVRLLCCGASRRNYSMMQYLFSHVRSLSSIWNELHANDTLAFASILMQSGIYTEAAKLQETALESMKRRLGVDYRHTIEGSANLACAYHELGRYAEAEILGKEVLVQETRLLGKDHPDTIHASANLAATYNRLGRYAEAEILHKEVLAERTRLLGKDHPDTIRASANLAGTYRQLGRYAEAEVLDKEVLAERTRLLGKDHPDTIDASANLASTYHQLGRYAEAEILHKEVLAERTRLLGKDHPNTIDASANLASTYRKLGRYTEAEILDKEVLAERTRLLGKDHPDTIHASSNLASTYHQLGRHAEAEILKKEVLAERTRLLGKDHPDTIRASANLASTYHQLGRYYEAEILYKEVLAERTRLLGKDHPDTIDASANLASTYHQLGRYAEAEILDKEVLAERTRLLGKDHPGTIHASANLAGTYHQLGRYAEAEILKKEVLAERTRLLGKDHPDTIRASANLASTYHQLGRYYEAEILYKEVLAERTRLLGKDHPDTIHASANLTSTYHQLGRYADAEILEKEVLAGRTRLLGKDHPDTIHASSNLASTYHQLGRHAEAEILKKEVLAERTRLLGKDHPDTMDASANLAGTYCQLGRYAEAEVLEKEVLEQRTRLLGIAHPDTLEAMISLAYTYGATRRRAEAYEAGERARRIALETQGEDGPVHQRACRFLADLGYERTDKAIPQQHGGLRRRDRFLARIRQTFL